MDKVTVPALRAMKREGRKVVGIVVWDAQMASIAERAGAEIVSVGDTVGTNLWGRSNPLEVTLDEMVVVARAARRGTTRALLSADFPFGPLQRGAGAALDAAIRLVQEAGVDMVKLDGAEAFPEAVEAVARVGIPVWAQFGITPQTALAHGVDYAAMQRPGTAVPEGLTGEMVAVARRLEAAGASLLDFQNSGEAAGTAVAAAVSIPVLGGLGGGPWLDGRVRMAHAAIGYAARNLDEPTVTYANVARLSLEALTELAADVRAGRHIKGQGPRAREGA